MNNDILYPVLMKVIHTYALTCWREPEKRDLGHNEQDFLSHMLRSKHSLLDLPLNLFWNFSPWVSSL